MAVFREAESRSLDLDRALPALVQGRNLSSADDIAAVVHHRVRRWLQASGRSEGADHAPVLGCEIPGWVDPESARALAERRSLIAQRLSRVSWKLRWRSPA